MSKELPKRWRKKKTDKLEARPAGRFGLKASVSYLLLEQRMVFDGAAVDTAAAATADPAAPAALPGRAAWTGQRTATGAGHSVSLAGRRHAFRGRRAGCSRACLAAASGAPPRQSRSAARLMRSQSRKRPQ
jgi:hypothetical protein